jgi:hypothetical protein
VSPIKAMSRRDRIAVIAWAVAKVLALVVLIVELAMAFARKGGGHG